MRIGMFLALAVDIFHSALLPRVSVLDIRHLQKGVLTTTNRASAGVKKQRDTLEQALVQEAISSLLITVMMGVK